MCGITGWVDFERDLHAEHATVSGMTDTLACRGPDADGVWISTHAALGHRRLAIIDLDGGRQPMTAEESGECLAVLTFCGEIYNFRALRAELTALGHRFRTRCDTEVILRGYLQWGAAVADRLAGMFAFALWDPRADRLLLARDRLGIKPLYYLLTSHGVLFGSEPKAVLANPLAPRRVDAAGLCEILDMVKTPGHAIFADLREVRPGTVVQVDRTGIRTSVYWQLEARVHTDSLEVTIDTVRNMLAENVSAQLVADVPVCALLSGGLDSSAVTAIAAQSLREQGKALSTFSVNIDKGAGFEADAVRGSPDTPFAFAMAEHVRAMHTDIVLGSAELSEPKVRDAVLQATDLPPGFWGDMWPSLYLFSQAIRREFTVALSGEGADELFGGYQWFRNPRAVAADTFPWLTPGSARYFGGSALLDRNLLARLDIPAYRAARYHEALAEVPRLPGEAAPDGRMRAISYLNLTRFLQTLLDRKDRMSMAVGLEVRVPYCDHRLVDYVFNAPWQFKAFDGREKSLLRAAVADLLPASVLERAKTPYPAIQDSGYEHALRVQLRDVLADPHSPVLALLDLERARRALARPLDTTSQPYDRGSLELTLWLNTWLKTYTPTLDL